MNGDARTAVEPEVPLVDPHHHLWNLQEHYYPWLSDQVEPAAWGTYDDLLTDYLLADYLADAAGQNLVKSVHLDVGWDPSDPVGETRWLQSLADEHGFPHGIVGYADLAAPDVSDLLDAHLESPNFRGIRQSMNFHEDRAKTYTDRPEISRTAEWRRGFALLAERGLSFDLQLYYSQMVEFRDLARDFPEQIIVLNHTGMQVDGPDHFEAWRRGMRALASAPNVLCKISGLGMGDHHWTVESIRPYVETTIEFFGTERCMFASNFPVDKLFATYGEIFDAFRTLTREYSLDEKHALFHANAERTYRI